MLYHRLGRWGCGWLLLLMCQLSRAVAQNHTCHRTNKVEVRVAVPVQEPATFRSYTWCLKVPPRCSKYTVVTRERITYQTEVRNETITECCAGFVSLYGECVAQCACPNMLCDATRNCTCAPGYIGPYCNQTCAASRWGDRCTEACVCRLGEDCDPASGSCSPSTSTVPPPTSTVLTPTINTPSTSTVATGSTTPNSFLNLSLSEPTTSAEDLSEFNTISLPKSNESVRLVNGNEASVNALDLDYPVLPTDSVGDSYNYLQPDGSEAGKSVVTASWMSELGAQSGVTLGSALGLVALLVVVVSVVVRCRSNKVASQLPNDGNSVHLVVKSHYAVPGPPPFTFNYGYATDSEVNEDSYDHPRGVRCLAASEPVYDELRY